MKHHNCLAQLFAGFCFGLFACSSLSAQVEFDNPFHGVYSINYGGAARPGLPAGQSFNFNPTLYWDYFGMSINVEQTSGPRTDALVSKRSRSTSIMAGLAGTLPLLKGRWRPWLDAQISIGNGDNTPFGGWLYGYGAQLRLPVIRDKFFLCLRFNRIAPLNFGDFKTLNYGIGIAYEHRAKPLKK